MSAVLWLSTAVFAGVEEDIRSIWVAYPPLNDDSLVTGGVILQGTQLADAGVHERLCRIRQADTLVFADLEGGRVNALRETHGPLPSARTQARRGDQAAEEAGLTAGSWLADLGVHVDLAPVVDLGTDSHLGRQLRTYGDDPEQVVAAAAAFQRGLTRAGVGSMVKHYPGYGATRFDTDLHPARTETVLSPSARALFGRVEGEGVVMAAVRYEGFAGPALFEPALVEAASVHGVVMTDDLLAPGTVASAGSPEQSVERAFLAGNDLLVTSAPPDWEHSPDVVAIVSRSIREDPSRAALLADAVARTNELRRRRAHPCPSGDARARSTQSP